MPKKFQGSSAVYYAIHRDDDKRVLEDWGQEYGLDLSLFLPHTFGSEYFFSHVVSNQMFAT